ncbi:hypothetical protein CIB84_009273 [Bambusicola thoracicus]|uniref:Uncharacterized protein n=1 Tax=Bambusicola thoracicus TaxID=9083 RepID=A0A2P4SSA3_BAMTH|nr:hypothetical protein CIB84_009273 [Bambusicola thoracicus]
MKLAFLCLCFIGIAAAWPVSKSRQHAISASSEEKYYPRSHHTHRYHQDRVDSQSQEQLQQTQNDLASLQQTHYSSEENADVPEQPESREQDSRELAQHQSVENDSRPKFDSPEVDGGDSKASAGVDSRESRASVSAVDTSNQTLESAEDAEDRHSIENNEVTR